MLTDKPAKKWYRGNFHCHSQWSDGKDLPECQVRAYKERGYHFLCLSDHNIFQGHQLKFDLFLHSPHLPTDLQPFKNETSLWKFVSEKEEWPYLTMRWVDDAIDTFGEDSVRILEVGGESFVRLKTFTELKEMFAEPELFLLVPGFELSDVTQEGRYTHVNFVNVMHDFPCAGAASAVENIRIAEERGREEYADQSSPYLLCANHPQFQYYDYNPSDLIALPQVHFFELNNNYIFKQEWGVPAEAWTPELFWDVVNSHRASQGQKLLFGMGSDDSHDCSGSRAFCAWTVVRAESLSFDSLYKSLCKGDFYASTGPDFKEISFERGVLRVRVKEESGKRYRIEFIGTRRGYDPSYTISKVKGSNGGPVREIELYGGSIGVVFAAVDGGEASYTLTMDDLYVRARLIELPDRQKNLDGTPLMAWTQPFCRGGNHVFKSAKDV